MCLKTASYFSNFNASKNSFLFFLMREFDVLYDERLIFLPKKTIEINFVN